MEPVILAVSALITLIGGLLRYFIGSTSLSLETLSASEGLKQFEAVGRKRLTGAQIVLLVFIVLVVAFGAFTLVIYWNQITADRDAVIFGLWLIVFMVVGMFVQVIATNYRAGKPLFKVDVDQLIFPLLFSVVVFYPIWAIASSAERSFFSIHAAFLNGYFWESVVSSARLPDPPKPDPPKPDPPKPDPPKPDPTPQGQ